MESRYDDLITMESGVFEELTSHKPPVEEKYNYCDDCNIPMIHNASEYQCGQCNQSKPFYDMFKDYSDTSNRSIRITTGTNKGRFYNITNDYSKTQMKSIMDQLNQKQSEYSGPAFPHNILLAAAVKYNEIQKFITEDSIDEHGNVCGQKKFVRRGNIRDETLAGLIYFEGIREHLVRKKRDVAEFMKLHTCGFSRGEDILRSLHAEGKIDIPVDEEPIDGYIDRYMEALNLDKPSYVGFVTDIVNLSEQRKVGMSSQLSSKIVGAIWILIQRCKLGISSDKLEKATDNTKRNTFIKFYNVVNTNIKLFVGIFNKYNVPLK